jgi:hypothetical protein
MTHEICIGNPEKASVFTFFFLVFAEQRRTVPRPILARGAAIQ